MSEAHKLGVVTPCQVTQSTKGVVRETHNLLFFVLQMNIMNIADLFEFFLSYFETVLRVTFNKPRLNE